MNPDDTLPPGATIPPQAGAKDQRYLRSASGRTEIQSVRYVHGWVDKDSNCFGWALLARLDVLPGTLHGEHVTAYFKGYRHQGASAPMWPLCAEATDLSGQGNLWGAEIDVMSRGSAPAYARLGIGLVFGEACLRAPDGGNAPPTYELVRFSYGLVGLPFRRKLHEGTPQEQIVPDNVEHDCWMTTFVKCTIFAAVPPGTWITWDDIGQCNVGEKFDPPTGFQLQGRRDIIGHPNSDWTRAAIAFQRDTGAVYQFGIEVIPACPLEFRPVPGESAAAWQEKMRKRIEWMEKQKRPT